MHYSFSHFITTLQGLFMRHRLNADWAEWHLLKMALCDGATYPNSKVAELC